MKLFWNWTTDRGNQFLTGLVTSIVEKKKKSCEHLLKGPIPCIPAQWMSVPSCEILRYQRLEQLCSGSLWFVICCPSEWLEALWSSASQLFGPGLLHNYIKAWSTAQPQHPSYKYDYNTSSLHSSPLCTLLSSSYPCCSSNMLEEALGRISPGDLCHCCRCHALCKDACRCEWIWTRLHYLYWRLIRWEVLLVPISKFMEISWVCWE